jgi:hypothetical protein
MVTRLLLTGIVLAASRISLGETFSRVQVQSNMGGSLSGASGITLICPSRKTSGLLRKHIDSYQGAIWQRSRRRVSQITRFIGATPQSAESKCSCTTPRPAARRGSEGRLCRQLERFLSL